MAAIATPGFAGERTSDYVKFLFSVDPVLKYCSYITMPEGGKSFPREHVPPSVSAQKYDTYTGTPLTDLVFDTWIPTPHLLVTRTRISKAVLVQDDDGAAEQYIQQTLLKAMRNGLVYQLLRGGGTNSSATPPIYEADGILSNTNVNHVTYTASAKFDETVLAPAIRKMVSSNVNMENLIAVMSPSSYSYNLFKRRKSLPAET